MDASLRIDFLDDRTVKFEKDVPEGVMGSTVRWPDPPTDEQFEKAVRIFLNSDAEGRETGTGHNVRRFVMPGRIATVFLAHDWGPPLWRYPKVLFRLGRKGFTLGIGWRLHCYRIDVKGPGWSRAK